MATAFSEAASTERRWKLTPRNGAILLFLIGIAHRALQIWLMWPALSRQIMFAAGDHVQTVLPEVVMRDHPWWGLWYLQQTPPLSFMVWVVIQALFHDPYWIAVSCLMLQAALSSATAAFMALLLWRLGVAFRWAFAISLVFLLAGGLIVIEYHTMGQMWHNLMAMLLTVLAGHVGVTLSHRITNRSAFHLGLLSGILVLTRATFSYFAPVMAVWLLLAGAWRRPVVLLAFLAPVVVLQGGWTLKNYLAFGYVSTATSSWGGANLYHGEVGRHGAREFKQWIKGHKPLCPSPWYELTVDMPPKSAIFYFIPVEWPEGVLPPEVVAKDALVVERRGAAYPWDSLAGALWSQCLMKEFSVYWAHRPALVAKEWWMSYEIFWHPIGQYTVVQPLTLQPDVDKYSMDLNWWKSVRDAFGELGGRYLLMQRKVSLAPLKPSDLATVPVLALPVLPDLISQLNLIVLHSLPLLLLVQWARGYRSGFPRGFWFLVILYVYAAGFSSLGEYSENMRYRLEIEPVIWVLSLVIAIEWGRVIAFRRARERTGAPVPSGRGTPVVRA